MTDYINRPLKKIAGSEIPKTPNMSEKYLLGIDIGTGSCKTTIVTSEGKVADSASKEYSTSCPKSTWAEQNPEDWYLAFKTTLAQAVKKAGILTKNISAVGVTGQMVGFVCLDEQGSVLRPTILWMDQRSMPEVNWLQENFGEKIRNISYTPINTAFILPKVLWVKKHEPEIWENIYKIQLPKDYIKLRLTGRWTVDYNDASGTLLFDVANLEWSEGIAQLAEISLDKLPDAFPSTDVVGYLTKEASEETGLKVGTPVVAGSGDLAAENFSAGVVRSNQRLTRLGSAASTASPLDKPVLDPKGMCPCYVHCVPDKWLIEATTQAFGLSERWFKDAFCSEEILKARELNTTPYSLIDKMVSEVPMGADGLFFHPFITGSPYWDSDLRGTFLGITGRHAKKHFARAVLEGAAYSLRDALGLLDSLTKGEIIEYILVGGGSRSTIWPQIVCDVLGTNAILMENADACVGAAMLAGVGTGIFKDVDEAISRCAKRQSEVHYNKDSYNKYSSLFAAYREIHDNLKKICKTLSSSPVGNSI